MADWRGSFCFRESKFCHNSTDRWAMPEKNINISDCLSHIPDWLSVCMQRAIIGEVYPQIRAIAAKYNKKEKKIIIRYYLIREPTEFDYESIDMVATELDTTLSRKINIIDVECIFSDELIRDLDPLDGFVYARREYEMQDNPVP